MREVTRKSLPLNKYDSSLIRLTKIMSASSEFVVSVVVVYSHKIIGMVTRIPGIKDNGAVIVASEYWVHLSESNSIAEDYFAYHVIMSCMDEISYQFEL